MIDNFVRDIREYTAAVSGCTSPAGIILFADWKTDMKLVLEKMDYAMSPETVIVGDEGYEFLYTCDSVRRTNRSQSYSSAVVALARERDKPPGVGETQFHVAVSTGVSPISPTYKAVSVREKDTLGSTWLTAKREGFLENLDGQTILNHVDEEMGDPIEYPVFYIGVTKRRKCSIGSEKVRWVTSQIFHAVLGGDEEYLCVGGAGIKTGDCFRFYRYDANVAASSSSNVSDKLRHLKQDCDDRNHHPKRGNKKEVFGGIIFCCCNRGDSFFGRPAVDSSPFLENFPGVTLAGTYRPGEIGRGDLSSYGEGSLQQSSVHCCLLMFSCVYLVMSYYACLPEY